MRAKRRGAVALLCLLAGCSGGSGGGGEPLRSYEDLADEALALADEIKAMDTVPGEDLPVSGKARYEGIMAVTVEDGSRLAGAMEMEVDFGDASDPVSGRVSNIVSSDEERYGGSLALSDSRLDRTADGDVDPTLVADLGGTVTGPDDRTTRVEADIWGSFGGEGASHAGGFVGGRACTAGDCQGLDGAFILEPPGGTGPDTGTGGTGAAVGGSVCNGDCGGDFGSAQGVDPDDI
ncbi:hypothetical protein [Rubellimicrobium roseum]|uniref:Transferrin-binding protein-like solute binding protein n=1 Tax=Rubellimicrobium roseum TaxID=687525 RepID=A0A5C4NKV3_9RHOB|nr:hypothetical protein [Rubellimicrobium roseum]TNC73756.1 hypothetical protein FHG71_04565 [Rubellimicrobium roseum]